MKTITVEDVHRAIEKTGWLSLQDMFVQELDREENEQEAIEEFKNTLLDYKDAIQHVLNSI